MTKNYKELSYSEYNSSFSFMSLILLAMVYRENTLHYYSFKYPHIYDFIKISIKSELLSQRQQNVFLDYFLMK